MENNELGGYQIVGRLAVGGMAEVFQAKVQDSAARADGEPEEVALKRLLPAHRNDAAWVQHFVDEAKLTVRLRHPHLVRTFRCFKAGPDYLTVQELISGRTLDFMQDAFRQAGSPLPLMASTYIASCVLRALEYVHRVRFLPTGGTVVHRDVSPANILLSVQGEVKLTDFGVAEVEGLMRGAPGALRGTPAYMAPEAVLGKPVDHRTDLFSVGVILHELFSGQPLFHGGSELEVLHRVRDGRVPSVQRANPSVPEQAARIVRRALQSDARLRFQSATEFLEALQLLAARNGWPTTVEAIKPILEG